MEVYSNIFYNTIISEQKKGITETVADFFFLPVLYFSGGKARLYSIVDKEVFSEKVLFPQVLHKSRWDQGIEYLKTLVAIITYTPGIILGYLSKSFAMWLDTAVGERQEIVANYIGKLSSKESITIEIPGMTVTIPKIGKGILEDSHRELDKAAKAIADKLKTSYSNSGEKYINSVVKLWESQEMIELSDDFMELMIQEVQIFMKELKSEGKDDITEIVSLLENQVPGKYCWKFFAMAGVYHTIRSMGYYVDSPVVDGDFLELSAIRDSKGVVDSKLEAPFFTEGTKQYKWRQYYNYFCHQFKDIFPHMRDVRFQSWAKPDEEKGLFVAYPGNMPT